MTLVDGHHHTEPASLADLTDRELTRNSTRARIPARGLWPRRRWLLVVTALVVWSLLDATIGRGRIVNPGGWTQVRRFVGAAANPELSRPFLDVTWRAMVTTAEYALVGTALATVIGVVGGVLVSETWWRSDPLAGAASRRRATFGRNSARLLALVPRGIHEAIWALICVYVLGRNPLVAVIAIGTPFGAITAKVIADAIDDRAQASVEALRGAGAGRLSSMLYGVAPHIVGDVLSYGFYRLECAVRSSVVLGAIGAGGLGFQLSVSFQSLRYREIWTLMYALIALSAVADWWGASLRRNSTVRRRRISALVAIGLTSYAAFALRLRPTTVVAARARRLAGELAAQAWPPRLPVGGWSKLAVAVVDTVQLSVIAIAIAVALAATPAVLATRGPSHTLSRRFIGFVARIVLLVTRSIPPTIWALMILFVIFPGPLPGGLALGCYTAGVIGRLGAEIIENSDRSSADALLVGGATPLGAFAYGTAPVVAARFTSLTTYRWEVAARETVIVGLVGAGGLGRLLGQQNAAFDEGRMLTTVAALIVVSLLIDVISGRVRAALR